MQSLLFRLQISKKKFENILIKISCETFEKWINQTNFMNDDLYINCITKTLIKIWKIKFINEFSIRIDNFDRHQNTFINIYKITTKIKNNYNKKTNWFNCFIFFKHWFIQSLWNFFEWRKSIRKSINARYFDNMWSRKIVWRSIYSKNL